MKTLPLLIFLLFPLCVFAQNRTLSGSISDKQSGEKIGFATVVIPDTGQWTVSDADGRFTIKNIPQGTRRVNVSCLGYISDEKEIIVSGDILNYKVLLNRDNLAMEGVVVTAQSNENSAATSRMIDKSALEHIQMMNVSDISSLLPGGATKNNDLTETQRFDIRSGGDVERGNPSFGTAVEVDGVRLSNNASFRETKGVPTNNIASSNVESIEVISGVPSVEYGDVGSGIVKINTRSGATPWTLTMSTSPMTKQVSVSKGFGLGTGAGGQSKGVLNASAEYTRSISETMSPYTSYERKQVGLTYSKTFSYGVFADTPLRISLGFNGNLGGLDNSADPDKLIGTFLRSRDNNVRGNLSAEWLLGNKWITDIDLKASLVYSDKLSRENSNYHQAVSYTSMHATSQGYYMADEWEEGGLNPAVLIAPGTWYNVMAVDDRPLNTKIALKANWVKNSGRINNKLKLGGDWTSDKNFGAGVYSEDQSTAPTYRKYPYSDVPAMTNLAAYVEDNFMLDLGKGSRLNVILGLRNDNTIVKSSAYGTTSSLSPRFNAKYTVFSAKSRRGKFLQELSFRGGWGVTVKQPSFSVLYPTPVYTDINVFTSTASAENKLYRAYYVMPRTIEYNSALRWQRNRQGELGMDANLGGNKISLSAYVNKTIDSYRLVTDFDRFSYSYTPASAVQGLSIPASDRKYTVNPEDGSITVSDVTGANPSVTVPYQTRKQLVQRYTEGNESNPTTRYGLEWVIDFKRIKPINSVIRLDGSYYSYRSVSTDMIFNSPTTTSSYDGSPYKYIGYYFGGDDMSNGKRTSLLKSNVTITTNIPKVRMIVSVKLEASLLKYSRSLSERPGRARSYVLSDRTDLLSITDASVYDGEVYTVLYPDWYCSYDDPTLRPFLDDFRNAKTNDPELFSDLSKLVVPGASYTYTFLEDYISPYLSANISFTKEIGDLASISFYANNFFNNMGQVYSTKTKRYSSVFSYIPSFYYGLTLRLKF